MPCSDPSDVRLRFVQVRADPAISVRVAWLNRGAKPSFVIIPGWLSDIEQFIPLARAIASHGEVMIYEPHGFGLSRAPHRRHLYRSSVYGEEMARLLSLEGFEDGRFALVASSAGCAMALDYAAERRSPRPGLLGLLSPQEKYRTPRITPILDLVPSFLLGVVQKLIVGSLGLYLGLRGPQETATIRYAAGQLARSDIWAQKTFLVEYLHPFDFRTKVDRIDVPFVLFTGKSDWLAGPDPFDNLAHHRLAHVESLPTGMHRVQIGNETEIAHRLAAVLSRMSDAEPARPRPAPGED